MGNFWLPIRFSLQQNINTIDSSICLHNFVVLHDLEIGQKRISRNHLEFDDEVLAFMSANPSEIVGIFGDEMNDENREHGDSEIA